jgi:hypothetical protein
MFKLFKLLVVSKIRILGRFIERHRDVIDLVLAVLILLILLALTLATLPISVPVWIYIIRKHNKKYEYHEM